MGISQRSRPICYGVRHYQFAHFVNIDRTYDEIMQDVYKEWERIDSTYSVPYYPHVSIGWDNNPRFKEFQGGIVRGNTPQALEKALLSARNYANKHGINFIIINSWNEWTETSYLEPDDLNGYCYLQTVKRVFMGIENEIEINL